MYPPRTSGSQETSLIESCRDHIDALYALGLIRTGDDSLAMKAVANAIASAGADPLFGAAGPALLWRLLASHVRGPDERPDLHQAATLEAAVTDLSLKQEAIALVAAGRGLDYVAVLLGTFAGLTADLYRHR